MTSYSWANIIYKSNQSYAKFNRYKSCHKEQLGQISQQSFYVQIFKIFARCGFERQLDDVRLVLDSVGSMVLGFLS